MKRPDPTSNTQVAQFMNEFNMDENAATQALTFMSHGYDAGRKVGQAEAQRAFRLVLGIETPTPSEDAYWNLPVPLKEE